MKQLKNMQIIGIDNGYGNLKTASGIFPGQQDAGVWGRLDGGHARFEPKASTSLAGLSAATMESSVTILVWYLSTPLM